MDDDETLDALMRRLREGDPATTRAVTQELQALTVPRSSRLGLEPGKDRYVLRVSSPAGARCSIPRRAGTCWSRPSIHPGSSPTPINEAFARWDLGHLYPFRFPGGLRVGTAFEDSSERPAAWTKIARRAEGEVFDYEFDSGDSWEQRCTVIEAHVDLEDIYGVRPKGPVDTWGWGAIPDQYGCTTPDGRASSGARARSTLVRLAGAPPGKEAPVAPQQPSAYATAEQTLPMVSSSTPPTWVVSDAWGSV